MNRVYLFVGITLAFLGVLALEAAPPLWWDEGWTISVARNWVEQGHYGRYLLADPVSPRLAASFPIILPIALSFRLFGLGIWQARMVGVMFTTGGLLIMHQLALRWFNRKIALASILCLVFLVPLPMVNPLLNGRQVLADVPTAFFLLSGYLFFDRAKHNRTWLIGSAVCWAIALDAKLQTLPFFIIGIAVPSAIAAIQKRWSLVGAFTGVGTSAYVLSRLFSAIERNLLWANTGPQEKLEGLHSVIALVPDPEIRMRTLIILFLFGLPTLIGLIWSAKSSLSRLFWQGADGFDHHVKLSLIALAGSWIGWYGVSSNGGERYLATPIFLGGPFVALMVHDFTQGFQLKKTVRKGADLLRLKADSWDGLKALIAAILLVSLPLGTLIVFYTMFQISDRSIVELAEYINLKTPSGSVIETYESELFFLLERDYHYPPDYYHVAYLRRYLLEPDLEIDYDPLAADPDYLVVGQLSADWRVYDQVLATDEFRLIETFTRYQVYERVRE